MSANGGAFVATHQIRSAAPDWITPKSIDLNAETPVNKKSNGTYYLLSDEQVRLAPGGTKLYRHLATRAIDQRGVEAAAHISFDFDPSFQTPHVHMLRVYRASDVQDRLNSAEIKVLQREKDLESRIYDGSQTVDVVLSDVRPGDVVEYAYSVEGLNPVLCGSEFGRFNLQWSVPVAEVYRRLVTPAGQQLKWRGLSGAQEPKIASGGGRLEYSWHLQNVAGASDPDDTPEWWSPLSRVEWAMSSDWAAVARWAEPLYADHPIADSSLDAEIVRIAAGFPDPEKRIGAVLNFVQSNIRYLGIEIGAGSFAPRSPDVVYQKRFGDCKDKVVLAVAMLRRLGIEAFPALVNTRLRAHVDEHLPSPGMFNHVVLVARNGASEWWLDPTRLPQTADVTLIGQANFGKALVLDGRSNGLTAIPVAKPSVDSKHVAIRVDASKGFGSQPTVEVVTRFEGVSAERMRGILKSRDLDELQHDYENWYARDYRGLKRMAPMTFRDDITLNRVTTYEHYELPTLIRQDSKGKEVVWLYARDMKRLLSEPSDSTRSAPLAINNPEEAKVVLTALLPDDRSIKEEKSSIRDTAFEFTSRTFKTGREMRMEYEYRALADHVMPGDLARYKTNLEAARRTVGYSLRPTPAAQDLPLAWKDLVFVFGPFFAFWLAVTIFVKGAAWSLRRAQVGWPVATSYALTCTFWSFAVFLVLCAAKVSPPEYIAGPLALVAAILYGGRFFGSRAITADGTKFGYRKGAVLSLLAMTFMTVTWWMAGAAYYYAADRISESTYRFPGSGSSQLARADAEKAHLDAVSKAKFDELDAPLRGIAMPFPALPREAVLPENTGMVQVEFFVESDGSVREVMPVGAPHKLLARVSEEAVLKWKFAPPVWKGKPTRRLVSQEFSFVVSD